MPCGPELADHENLDDMRLFPVDLCELTCLGEKTENDSWKYQIEHLIVELIQKCAKIVLEML